MSVQAMAWAIEQRRVTDPVARHVLLCLANYASKTGCDAWCSAGTLSKETGLSERTIRAKLDLLEADGAIRRGNQAVVAAKVERADRRPVVYDLDMERGAADAPRDERGASDAPREQERGAVDVATGCSSRQERGAGAAPNPKARAIQEQSEKQKPPAAALPDPPEWINRDAWQGYAEMRRKKRAAMTPRAMELVIAELQKLQSIGQDPDKVLDQSTRNGWTDVYALKTQESRNASTGKLSASEQTRAAIASRRRAESSDAGR